MEKDVLINNINKTHTTILGEERIKRNLNITGDVINYCKKIIQNEESKVFRDGKNYYCIMNNIKITINSYSYTIITAHKLNN